MIAKSKRNPRRNVWVGALAMGLLALWLIGGTASVAQSPGEVVAPTLVQTVNTGAWDPPSPEPAGLAYLPPGSAAAGARLLVADAVLPQMDDYRGANMFLTDLQGNLLQTFDTSSFAENLTGVTFNPGNGHLFMVDGDRERIFGFADPWNEPQLVTYLYTGRFGSSDPQDIAYDTRDGYLFVVDGRDEAVYRIDPGANGSFDNWDTVVSFDVEGLDVSRPRGVSYDAATDHLLVLDRDNGRIVEVTKEGELVRTIDISDTEPENPGALALLPAAGAGANRTLLVLDRGTWDDDDDDDDDDGGDDDDDTGDSWPDVRDWRLATAPANAGGSQLNTPLDHEQQGGFLFTFDLPSIVEPPTSTPPGVTTTPGTTGTPQATSTPGPTGTPSIDPRGAHVFMPLALWQRMHDELGEPNDACPQAFPLSTNRLYHLMPDDQHDWYDFTLTSDAQVTVRLTEFAPLSGQIAVYRAAQGGECDNALFIQNNGEQNTDKTVAIGLQPAGRYFIYVSNDGTFSNSAAYRLQVDAGD